MGHADAQSVWALARSQHGVVGRRQLAALGFNSDAINHRLQGGRLHRIHPGVYAVGTPALTRYGQWMAAVLSCGDGAVLSHASAAALWGIGQSRGPIEVSVSLPRSARRQGIRVHRRVALPPEDVTRHRGIPVTGPICTVLDLGARWRGEPLEAMINEADIRGLCSPEGVRSALERTPGRPGVANVRSLLDRRTFRLTRSRLERLFLPIAEAAGLPRPLTRQRVNGFEVDFYWPTLGLVVEVDFYWPTLGLVVETDSLRYHRTATQQTKDMLRDQRHTAAGLTCLRFSHYQVAYEKRYVQATLRTVGLRLRFLT
jgi:very-short-patch-repair endonuclease